MRKEIIIFFLGFIIVAGCSGKRKAFLSTRDTGLEKPELIKVSDVTELNFTAQPFFIQRAEINITGNNESQRVMTTIKFAKPDSFLISVRAFLGIEVARILLTGDTVLINDRLNQTLYFGSNQSVKRLYGFDLMFFPVLLGDLITGQQTFSGINCDNGQALLREFRQEYIINYFIACDTRKCKEVTVENALMKDYISIEFGDFGNDGEMAFPKRIKINNSANFVLFEMTIDRVEFNVTSGIEFIPGRNFTQVEIK